MTPSSVQAVRSRRQQEAADSFRRQGIIRAAPRFGKIKTAITIMQRDGYQRVLIAFPRKDILGSWTADFQKWNFTPALYDTSTFVSLKKALVEDWDLVIVDEIHEASNAVLDVIGSFVKRGTPVLGLSGTITKKTETNIFYRTDLALCYDYPIETAVQEGILSDYQIIVHKVDLDNTPDPRYRGRDKKPTSEREKFRAYQGVAKNAKGKTKWMMELKMIQILQNSTAKFRKTVELLERFRDDRVLVFCGTTEVADRLGIPAYHSKTKEKKLFEDFCNGTGNHCVTIKMAQAGITILPIHRGLINYTSGNPEDTAQKICRFLGIEYDNPEKIAEVHLVCSTELFEDHRIKTALQFFEFEKINFV